jgi:hypothetical protein
MNHYSLFIVSTTLPLHHFYYMHFANVRNFDPIHAASAVFIDCTTLSLRGKSYCMYVIYRPTVKESDHCHYINIPQESSKKEVPNRRISSFSQSGSAGLDLTLYICVVILKCPPRFRLFLKIKKENKISKGLNYSSTTQTSYLCTGIIKKTLLILLRLSL